MNAQQPHVLLETEAATVRSIGTILVESGVISASDAERIGRLQHEQNLRFGDAAILLGMLTEEQLRFALSKQFNYVYLAEDEEHALGPELIAAYQPFSPRSEQLRALRSQIGLRWFDRAAGQNALAVVSLERGAGRSYIAANLAVAFAQLGERTLLIDADMRNPRQHTLFNLDNRRGLSMLLSGRSEEDNVQSVAGFENLSVLTAGPTPPNPQELINKPFFKVLLDTLSERFDIILIDTAAMSSTLDAQAVAQRAGGALGVARKNETPLLAFNDMLASLGQSGVVMVGTVFNAPESTQVGHG